MQFLTVANFLLRRDTSFAIRPLCVTTFPVVPLPKGCGLIRWIEGVRPLYSFVTFDPFLAKNPEIGVKSGGIDEEKDGKIGGPGEETLKIEKAKFKRKKTTEKTKNIAGKPAENSIKSGKPAGKSQNTAKNRKNRRKTIPETPFFPFQSPSYQMAKNVLRPTAHGETQKLAKIEAFRSQSGKVDGAVLAKALWLSSASFGEFMEKKARFVRSAAAMSAVGHVLGLGDRHLGNILLDLGSGQLMHVDYNVCFEKGRRLSFFIFWVFS